MAYYRWRKSTVQYNTVTATDDYFYIGNIPVGNTGTVYMGQSYATSNQKFTINNADTREINSGTTTFGIPSDSYCSLKVKTASQIFFAADGPYIEYDRTNGNVYLKAHYSDVQRLSRKASPDTSQGYVYSTSSSAYPNGGVFGDYYYDQRTTIVSPIAPNSITYPSSITNQSVFITFTEATSEIPDYSVDEYEISYNANESSWVVAGTTKELSYSFNIPSVFTSNIMFRVRAKDTNGQWGDYKTGAIASVSLPALPPPVLTLPSSPVKINESFSISWTSVSEATGYVLQKKTMNKDSDWSEVYNGSLLSCVDTVNDLGLRYRISYKVNNFQSEWSQEYYLNIFEKLIEISCLDESGSYIPLYPVTSTVAVFNTSDLVNLTLSTGTYQGNGFETNSIALENSVDPKVAIITNSKQETTLVTNFNKNNMTVKESNNELGETYNYVIIGNNKSK